MDSNVSQTLDLEESRDLGGDPVCSHIELESTGHTKLLRNESGIQIRAL
jgi:hypothetical protein